MDNLVTIDGKEAYTTTLIIADGFEVEHRAVMQLLKKYSYTKTLSTFRMSKVSKGGRPTEYAMLNYKQTSFLITLMRNSALVVEFKEKLNEAFHQQLDVISRLVMQSENPDWQNVRRDGKEIYHQKTEVIKDFVDYATGQGSRNARMYYANLAKMENSALFFFEQKYKNLREVLTIKQLMQVATADDVIEKAIKDGMEGGLPYKECYKLAKERVVAFASIIGKSPVIGFETKKQIEG